MSRADQTLLEQGAAAMLHAQADLPPAVIQMLRVLLDRPVYPAPHVKWIEAGARAVIANWERDENLDQLRHCLGLDAQKKRRRTATMRQETSIVAAIIEGALAGSTNPKKAAGDSLQVDDRQVQRAWQKWGAVYLARLDLMVSKAATEDQAKIRAAIALLSC